MNIAIVGAGATGVELAAELRHAAGQSAQYGLDSIAPDDMRIALIDAGPRVLPGLSAKISASAQAALTRIGVTVLTSTMINEATSEGLVTREGICIQASMKVWAAGIRTPRFLGKIDGLEVNHLGQLRVKTTLQTTHDEDIFAFGDCAACPMNEDNEKNGAATRASRASTG